MMRDIWVYMNTLEIICGLHCYHCTRDADTVQYIIALHHWWNKESHKSHLQPNQSGQVRLYKQTLLRRVAGQLDGIGHDKAMVIDQAFRTVEELVNAEPEQLMEIEGIGKGLSASIIKQLRGGHHNGA